MNTALMTRLRRHAARQVPSTAASLLEEAIAEIERLDTLHQQMTARWQADHAELLQLRRLVEPEESR